MRHDPLKHTSAFSHRHTVLSFTAVLLALVSLAHAVGVSTIVKDNDVCTPPLPLLDGTAQSMAAMHCNAQLLQLLQQQQQQQRVASQAQRAGYCRLDQLVGSSPFLIAVLLSSSSCGSSTGSRPLLNRQKIHKKKERVAVERGSPESRFA